jgi:transposase
MPVGDTRRNAPQAAILFDKFHVLRHLGKALDTIRKREYGRLQGKPRTFIRGQKYTLLAHPSLGFVEGLNNKIRVLQRRAYGLRDEEYLRLKVLTCMLPKL